MARARNIVLVLIAVVIGATLFIPFASAIQENSGTQSVGNEGFDAELKQNISLDQSSIDSGSETIEYNNSGSWDTLSSSEYTIYYEPGIINISDGTAVVSNGTEMRASYDYEATDDQTTTVLTLAPLLLAVLLLVTLANRIMGGMRVG